MGQTLTNGVYLPDEGERNCYTGLAENWRALDYLIGGYNVHVADAVIHVSQADRDKWDDVDNKADASALTAHTGNTTIHVTAADKQTWNTVTNKANDADVLHKNAADTMPETLTFLKNPTVKNEDVTRGSTTGSGSRFIIFTDANNNALGSLTVSKVSNGSTSLSLRVDTTDNNDTAINSQFQFFITKSGFKVINPTLDGDIALGRASNKWSDVATQKINSLNPGVLGMPSSTSIDISAYVTDLSGGSNIYVAPENGIVSVDISNTTRYVLFNNNLGIGDRISGSNFRRAAIIPVRKNDALIIQSDGGTLNYAKFYPCQGNI